MTAPLRVFCQVCGLLMRNGFCLHGSAEDAVRRELERLRRG